MAQEVVKMKQGMSYSCKEKTIILNVFKYFKKTYPEKCVTEIVRRTAKATGCSEKSVFQFRKEEASVEGFKEPSKTKIRKNININSRFIKYDNSVREAIRTIIYDLKYKNIVPSLSTILKNVNGNEKLPNFSVMTLRRLLADMGFCYEKEQGSNKTVLVEKGLTKKEKTASKNCNSKSVPIQAIEHDNRNTTNVSNLPQPNPKPVTAIPPQSNVPSIPQNQMYVPHHIPNQMPNHMPNHMVNQDHRILPMSMPQHENHVMDSIHLQHSMMINHRMPQHHLPPPPPHHTHAAQHMGFMPHHPVPHHHNMVMQQ